MLKNNPGLLHIGLFIITLITTTLAGAEWMYGRLLFYGEETMTWEDFKAGFQFSIPFLLILTFHEFGHYFTARSHQIKVSLPYYFPLWLGFMASHSFGTMGAFIRIKEQIFSRKHYFDVGVSGPVAGFVIAILVIWFGFTNLPDTSYIFEIHPEYAEYGADYAKYVYEDKEGISVKLGDNLIYWFFKNYVVEDPQLLPHPNEIIHYPYLLAGYLALLFTALNLLPIGQLDGGHITYGLFGKRYHAIISRVLFTAFLFYAGLGLLSIRDLEEVSAGGLLNFTFYMALYVFFLYVCAVSMFRRKNDRLLFAMIIMASQFLLASFFNVEGYNGWLLFGLIIGRFLGVDHPKTPENSPLSLNRKIIGWIALVIFILCFSPRPLIFEVSGVNL